MRGNGIHFGRIEKVDALVDGIVHLFVAFFFGILVAPGHGTEAYLTDFDIGMGQRVVDHGVLIIRCYLKRSNLQIISCLLYTSPSPRDGLLSRMPSSA